MAQEPAPRWTVLRAGQLIDGTGGPSLRPAMVIVRNDRIESVGQQLPVPEGATILDLGPATLLPGLIDLHTHLMGEVGVHWEEELLKTTPSQAAIYGVKNARDTLWAGFTTCRDMGPTWPFTDVDLRNAIEKGAIPGPRLQVAGNYVSATGGAGDARQFSIYVEVPLVRNLADGVDEVRKRFVPISSRARFHQDPGHRRGPVERNISGSPAVFRRGASSGSRRGHTLGTLRRGSRLWLSGNQCRSPGRCSDH